KLYEWSGYDSALTPTITVDTNQKSFTDPDTQAKQTDPFSNTIYVAWATVTKAPNNASDFNPNVIKVMASADGAASFTTPITVNSNEYSGNQHMGYPELVVSQGTADGRVKGGQLTVAYTDFNSGHTGSTPVDVIDVGLFNNGGTAAV